MTADEVVTAARILHAAPNGHVRTAITGLIGYRAAAALPIGQPGEALSLPTCASLARTMHERGFLDHLFALLGADQ